jgi:type IV pilus assembly protein PilW
MFIPPLGDFSMFSTKQKGFSLVELLVAMALASMVGVILISTYTMQVRAKNTQEALTDMNQNVRAALEIMTHEIRAAGLDPTEEAEAEIDTATAGELIFSMDRRDDAGTNAPDGDCCDANEQVRYHLSNDGDGDGINDVIADGTECHLGRETGAGLIATHACGGGGGGLQPLARNVDVLNFVYLDADGAVIPTPVAAGSLDDIRAIEVTIVARAGDDSRGFFSGNYTNNETYQNLQGTDLLVNPNDGFRRIRMATTIVCRNMFNK